MSKKTNSILLVVYFIVGLNIFFGLLKGVINLMIGEDFFDAFFGQTGWIISLFFCFVFIVVMVFLFGGGKNNSNK